MSLSQPTPPTLVLGSTSRYRQELLSRLRVPFICCAPHVDEAALPSETPADQAARLAEAKARAVAAQFDGATDVIVIGSDQVADLAGQALGKPGTHERAMIQLRAMRGHSVVFHTAVSVVRPATGFEAHVISPVRVQFRADVTDAEMDQYLRLDQPYDCAGSAKVESLGPVLLDSVESNDPTALVGLPLIATTRLLRAAGLPLFALMTS